MFKPLQRRALSITGTALPTWGGAPVLTISRLSGKEKLGKLYEYSLDLTTVDDPTLGVWHAKELVSIDALVGTEVTVSIEFEGKGTFVSGLPGFAGSANLGAGTRDITGLITEMRCTGADDRHVYYRVIVRPWLWLATRNRENRIFQNQSVVEITESILKERRYPFPYEMRVAAPGLTGGYPKRDYVRQFWQSDFTFLSMLWREWGLYFFMDGATLVLCDSPGSHRPHGEAYDTIFYHAPDGRHIDEEHIHKLEVSRELTAGAVKLIDYDPTRSRARLGVTQAEHSGIAFANAEHYGWGDYSQPLADPAGLSGEPNDYHREAEHLARVRVDAMRCRSLRARGTGNLRGLVTGQTFRLQGFSLEKANAEYLVVSTRIDIRNVDETSRRPGENAQYRCVTNFVLQPANTFFKNRQIAKKPLCSAETAVVVGPDNQVMWVDGYARVKVQFVWDRRGNNNHNSSCWVRVSSPWQGAGFGSIYIPRIGQEVTVSYHEGDPDKPYVSDRMVNQFNQPPWRLPDNQALSGTRTHEVDGGMSNSIVADDTTGKLQVQITSDYAQSRLILGYNTRIQGDAGRAEGRGEGWELATDSWGVIRANRGMLITTETRLGAQAAAKDMGETVQRLKQAGEQHEELVRLARQHNAQHTGADQRDVTRTIQAQNTAIRGSATTDSNAFPELSDSHVIIASPAGIESTTAQSTHIASGENLALTTGAHVGIATGGSLFASVRAALSLFVQQLGMRLIAASGKVEIQAQSDNVEIIANQVLKLISAKKRIEITAAEEILLNARGSYIRINGAGIEHGTPAKWVAYADDHDTGGPKSLHAPTVPDMPKAFSNRLDVYDIFWLKDFEHVEYVARRENGDVLHTGTLDEDGRTHRFYSEQSEKIQVLVGTQGGWLVDVEGRDDGDRRNSANESASSEQDRYHYVNLSA